uniref:UBC core domain-containing protein n=1 Tax=Steinernema glaseri TaxID=37863 RepID=A0A1I7XY39_9BILA
MAAATSGSTTNGRKSLEKSFLHSRRKKLIMQKCINSLGSKVLELEGSDSPCATSGPLLWEMIENTRPYPWPYPFPLPCTGAFNEQNFVPRGISP